jgi:hypothetical protein
VDAGDADRLEERESTVEALRAENAALRAELERMHIRYEAPVDPPDRSKETAAANGPEQFALVGPALGRLEDGRLPDEASDRLGRVSAAASRNTVPGVAGATTAMNVWYRTA